MPERISSARPDDLRRYADLLAAQGGRSAAEGRRLADAIGRLTATCREYRLGDVGGAPHRVQAIEGRDAELAGWARGVAEAYAAADRDPIGDAARWALSTAAGLAQGRVEREIRDARDMLAGGQVALGAIASGGRAALNTAARAIDWASWNWAALRLRSSLGMVDSVTWLSGDHLWGAGLGASIAFPILGPSLMDIGRLILMEDGPRWAGEPVDSLDDPLSLIEQGFWNLAFARVEPGLLLSLAAEIEELNRRTCADRDACANPRPPQLAEGDLSPQQAFPGAVADPATGELRVPAWATMAGGHSLISSYRGEQISMARIGRDEYLVAICGLDPQNMAVAPNGLVAVIQTATGDDHMQNAYFRLIKTRFLRYLEQIPPGSTLHVTGHSMGGGMSMLILNDPEVQAALLAGGYTLGSVVTYGAVRPQDPRRDGVPPSRPSELAGELFADTEVRHYVDEEDRLAMNVGAGHMDDAARPLPGVHVIANGALDSATAAHTSYDDQAKYAALPGELQELPFQIDPAYWELHRSPGPSAWSEELRERWRLRGEPPPAAGA